jgi:hypothetical protein
MSKRSERFERLDRACETLFQAQGESFRVKDLAREAGVSNSVAGPHLEYWRYRRDHDALVTNRAPAEPLHRQNELLATCEVANGANANVRELILMVNRLLAEPGRGKEGLSTSPSFAKSGEAADEGKEDSLPHINPMAVPLNPPESTLAIPIPGRHSSDFRPPDPEPVTQMQAKSGRSNPPVSTTVLADETANLTGLSSTDSSAGPQPAGDAEDLASSPAFLEGVAEAVLVTARRALPVHAIYSRLPDPIRNRCSRLRFREILDGSNRLHYDEAGKNFHLKIVMPGDPPEAVPLPLALADAAAGILGRSEGGIGSKELHSQLETSLRELVSPDALQEMLMVGSVANPVIEADSSGKWRIAGLAPLKPSKKALNLLFEGEVKELLGAASRPMKGVDIHSRLSKVLQDHFNRDKMYRYLGRVGGICQTPDGKWWPKAKRVPKPLPPVDDPGKSERAASMAVWKEIMAEAERVVVAKAPEAMSLDRIFSEVNKRYSVDDRDKFRRALNVRRKAEKSKIVRVGEGNYRARTAVDG